MDKLVTKRTPSDLSGSAVKEQQISWVTKGQLNMKRTLQDLVYRYRKYFFSSSPPCERGKTITHTYKSDDKQVKSDRLIASPCAKPQCNQWT